MQDIGTKNQMRVLLNYHYQYFPYTTASYIEYALQRRKDISYFRLGEDRLACADFYINIEPCEFIARYPGRPSIYWEIDNHIHRGADTAKYGLVDKVYIAQNYFKDLYPQEKTEWLPLGADIERHKRYPEEEQEFDVGFIGNDTYPHRRALLEAIGKKYKLLRTSKVYGEDYARMLSQCKIIFNCAMDNDINMRVFEGLAIGRLLMTDMVQDQDKLIEDGKHYICYKEEKDLLEKIRYYLDNDTEREAIAKAGADEVKMFHTYDDRLTVMLEGVKK